jgi:hypothetical protein
VIEKLMLKDGKRYRDTSLGSLLVEWTEHLPDRG